MDGQLWTEHLLSWRTFLYERLAQAEEEGERIKIARQLKTIERVRCAAVLNPALLKEFIQPAAGTPVEKECADYFLTLNASQKKAVRIALGSDNLSLIQGPPGTGKTQVIAEICLQLCRQNPGIRILVCSETHIAVNNLISRIADYDQKIRIVRIRDRENDDSMDAFSPGAIVQSYLSWAEDCLQDRDAFRIIAEELGDAENRSLEMAFALSANITGMTCNRTAAYDFGDTTEMFDVAIIDEVCKATLPEILAPLLISKKAILIGDPRQLPPVFCSEEQDIIRSIQGCNLDKYMYIDRLFETAENTTVLDTQYRMSNQIGDMISRTFYEGRLKNGRNRSVEGGLVWMQYQPSRQWPVEQKSNADRLQIYNRDECAIIKSLLKDILENGSSDATVAVIAPYKAQIRMLRESCPESERIRIDTVDGFQGKESDIVIFSVTRTTGPYRFLADERRLNVALSRARDRIMIVGSLEYCKRARVLRAVIERCTVRDVDDRVICGG